MAKSRKLTIQDAIDLAASRGGRCLSTEYKNNRSKLSWECSKGHRWCAAYHDVKGGGTWCIICAGRAPITLEDCHKVARERGGRFLSTEYKNNCSKLLWECGKCGHQWKAPYSGVKDARTWCPKCAGRAPITLDDCCKIAKERGGECLAKSVGSCVEKLQWKCHKCQHIWMSTYSCIRMGHWCLKCAKQVPVTLDGCCRLAEERGGKCLALSVSNARTPMLWECGQCNYQWKASYDNVVGKGSWCPKCAKLISKPELQILEFVRQYYPDAKKGKGVLPNKLFELDIHIPSLKKAIEYDGEYWHHSEWAIRHGSQERDARKSQQCQEVGIQLLRVREKDYTQDPEITKQKILEFLNG